MPAAVLDGGRVLGARVRLAAVIVVAATSAATAQDTSRATPAMTAIALGLPGTEGRALFPLATLGVIWNELRVNRVSPEAAVGFMPHALAHGAPVVGARIGLALPTVVGERMVLLPSAGVGGAMVVSSYVTGADVGVYGGFAAVFGTGRRSAFRLGATWHRLMQMESSFWLVELAVVRPFR